MTHVTHVSACCAIPSRLRFNVGAPGLCLTAHSTVVAGQRIRDAPHLWQGPRGAFCRRSSVVPVRTMPHPSPAGVAPHGPAGRDGPRTTPTRPEPARYPPTEDSSFCPVNLLGQTWWSESKAPPCGK